MKEKTLDQLCVGERAVVERVDTMGDMRRRFLDIGLIEGTEVECLGHSPLKDPSAYLIRGAVIAIRSRDCKDIHIRVSPKRCSAWD